MKLTELAYSWAKHMEINWYHAVADLEAIERQLGTDNTIEFAMRRMNGEKISLSDFALSKGIVWEIKDV